MTEEFAVASTLVSPKAERASASLWRVTVIPTQKILSQAILSQAILNQAILNLTILRQPILCLPCRSRLRQFPVLYQLVPRLYQLIVLTGLTCHRQATLRRRSVRQLTQTTFLSTRSSDRMPLFRPQSKPTENPRSTRLARRLTPEK
ncbi:MAG TPA: hypothetical protein VEJ87_07095 [Acidimicrobiales bacterium]|nr:hypothetical protein [Acidimicrobiales bacterium]